MLETATRLHLTSAGSPRSVNRGERELAIPTGLYYHLLDVCTSGPEYRRVKAILDSAHHERWHYVTVNEQTGRLLYDMLRTHGHEQGSMSQASDRLEAELVSQYGYGVNRRRAA